MPKSSGIKWTDKQTKELQRQVKRFNAKISRVSKKSHELVDFLPAKLSVKQLRQEIKTAKDLRLISAKVDRAFKDNAFTPIITKQGIHTTKYEIHEISLGVARINRARKKELEKAAPSTEKGTMGTVRENNLRPKKFNIDKITPRDWDNFVESVEKQSMASYNSEKMERYKENYIKGLRTVFGDKANDLIDMIENIPAKIIYDQYYQKPNMQLGFIYDPLEADVILDEITDNWNELTNEFKEDFF